MCSRPRPSTARSRACQLGVGPRSDRPRAGGRTWWSPEEPRVPYEQTKREADLLARSFAEQGAAVRIGIPGGIYGYGDESSMAVLIEAFATYPTPVGYMPELVQSLVNVDDCATGLRLIAERGRDGNGALDPVRRCGALPTVVRVDRGGRGVGHHRSPTCPPALVQWSSRPAAIVVGWARASRA